MVFYIFILKRIKKECRGLYLIEIHQVVEVDLSSIDLSSKANVSDVNALTTRVDTAETNINDLSALETIVTGSGDSDFTLTNVTQVTPNTSGIGFGGVQMVNTLRAELPDF